MGTPNGWNGWKSGAAFPMAQAVTVAQKIQGWMKPQELVWIFEQAVQLPSMSKWVEIGSWKGRSSVATILGLQTGSVFTAVDPHISDESAHEELDYPYPYVARQLLEHLSLASAMRDNLIHVQHMALTSEEYAAKVDDFSLDVVFIDGDHSFEGAAADMERWQMKVKPGGMLCGHDSCNAGVPKALKHVFGDSWKRGANSIWYVKL